MMKLRYVLILVLMATTAKAELKPFAEDGGTSDWQFNWNGYARLPLRLVDGPQGKRGPYLIDDHYTQSGFGYLRVNEREWVEFFLSAEHGPTRLVLGMQTSELSDWGFGDGQEPSPRTSPALAFVEHTLGEPKAVSARLRVGMLWERLGYLEPYDTYMIGRTHIAGASMKLQLNQRVELSGGLVVYSRDKLKQTRSSLLGWAQVSGILGAARLNLYALSANTEDDDREFGATEYDKAHRGELTVYGIEGLYTGSIVSAQLILAFYDARDVEYLGNAVELLHSEGGYWLKQHFLNHTAENKGTGEIQTSGFDVKLHLDKTLSQFGITNPWLSGWQIRTFGMSAWVATSEDDTSTDTVKENGRVYLKWGSDIRFMLKPLGSSNPYVALRYDRVILHQDHESLSFRVISPSIGVNPKKGLLLFAQWSAYRYGENLFARDEIRQRVGDTTRPDEHVFKIQTQVRW